jgi:hypothetical protein
VNNITTPAAQNPLAMILAPAKPTMDAWMRLRPLLDASADGSYALLDLKHPAKHRHEAMERYEAIPDDRVLFGVSHLFEAAEFKPADEDWLNAAIVMMLDSMPNSGKVSVTYRHSIVDAIIYDAEAWGRGYTTPFSCAVVTAAIREARRTSKFVPAHSEFLELCRQHRSKFHTLQSNVRDLIEVRQNAEDILLATGDLEPPDWEARMIEKIEDCTHDVRHWLGAPTVSQIGVT